MLACRKLRVIQSDLVVTGGPFSASRTIPLADIRSVEVYRESIVPPLVVAIFILAGQAVLLTIVKDTVPLSYLLLSNPLVLITMNAIVILCILLASLRVMYVTFQVALQEKQPLILHFVSRAAAEEVADYVQHMMKKQEKTVAIAG